MSHRVQVSLLACAALAAGCQKLNEGAAAGSVTPGGGGAGGNAGGNGGGGSPAPQVDAAPGPKLDGPPAAADRAAPTPDGPAAACEKTQMQAIGILQANCAFCHESPARMGNFDFILDVDTLVTAYASTGQRYLIPGNPDESRILQRPAAGEMPPPGRMPRPSESDIAALRQWIATCVLLGQPRPPRPDGGPGEIPPDGCGEPGQECCATNSCNKGGCCVLGMCIGSGQACGANGEGLPGMCSGGSCQNNNMPCGSLTQQCCGAGVCTGPKASCQMALCKPCGGSGQACCGDNGAATTCSPGFSCEGAGFQMAGSCVPCGAMGQPCCGAGTAAQKTCNGMLTCRFVSGMGDRCQGGAVDAGRGN